MSPDSTQAEKQQKICLFGGTFDPIHLGHTHIANAAVEQLGLDHVLFLPCRQSPHKTDQQHADAEHRLAMCRLATADFPWAEVNDHDLISSPPSYSWRTAEAMQKKFPLAQLYWLMGTDQWDALPRWHKPETLASIVEFIVFTRGAIPEPRKGMRMHAIKGNHPASATAIRQHPTEEDTHLWLHPKVEAYIKSNKLYQ